MRNVQPEKHSSLGNKAMFGPVALAEAAVVREYLEKYNGNIVQASKALMLNRNTVSKLVRIHKIDVEKMRNGASTQTSLPVGKKK